MNLNDFVVLPNNKAKSIKLNARNLQELQMETVSLAQESKEMEEKLQQLKQSMSKEKEERGHSGGFRWKSGQYGSLNSHVLTNSTKKNKENRLQKLSAGKVKIRVLKDEPLTAPPQPPPPPPPLGSGLRTTRKNRLRGTICGQCEVKTAGVVCAECTENYCIGCFARFHQKGALKLHRMITIQTDLQTHVSTRDIVSYNPSTFTSDNPSPNSKPNPSHTSTSIASTIKGDRSPDKGKEAVAKAMQLHPDTSQVLVFNHGEEQNLIEEGMNREDEKGFPTSLLRGEYNEEESARSFQEALRQWRGGETSDGAGDFICEEAMWIPVRPVSVSAMATQADLPPDREAEGRGSGGGQRGVPVRVEFTENSLTYMDRLLLKKHRRTPIETYDPLLAFDSDLKSLPNTNTEEDRSLTAQEEDFRRYCASLFAVPVSRVGTEAQNTTLEPCLVIEVLDETYGDIHGVFDAEHRSNNRQVTSSRRTLMPQSSLTSALSSKSMPSCPTAKTPRTSQTSIKTPISKSQKSNCSTTVRKSTADHGSPQLSQVEILKFSSPLSFPSDVSPLASTRSSTPKEHLSPSPSISFSLRSTFTVSPSSSTESTFLPRIHHSTPLQKDPPLLPEQFQSSKLFPEPISSLKLSQSPPSNLESLKQSRDSLCDPEFLLSVNQLQLPQSSRLNPQTKCLEPSLSQTNPVPLRVPVKAPSGLSLFNKCPPDAYSSYKLSSIYRDSPFFISSISITGDHESALSHQDTECIPSLSPHPLNVIQDPPLAVKMEEQEDLSIDSGDEMSSDSLGLASHEEGSSDEEAQMHGCLTRGKSREDEQGISAISHLGDSFVPTDAEREKYLRTDEPEQPSEPSSVMHNQCAGCGSEQFCDLDGFSPLGLDLNSGHCDTPEHTHCDPLRTCQTSPHDSDPTGSESQGPSSSLSSYSEKHLFFSVMEDNHMQPTGIQICSTTPTRRGETPANELGTSGSNWSGTSTPTLSHPPSPFPVPVFPSLSHFLSPPPLSTSLSHPTLGSELGPAYRPLSCAAQEIMEICSVDQTGCEDPDLDTDTTAHTVHGLEQELRLIADETGMQASVFGTANSGSEDRHGNQNLTRYTKGKEFTQKRTI
ncbi:zinc finger B-box domain-containing protein 1 isoform X2 [Trachinotus anak]|uniref:zinc finger B-box domain-containing protein 1 isoform X2 n=1 Tax=Trachinotus anak TaxID=443729 RepID=UPI0039F25F22